ncbi:uracil-DNA glycosylase family protein [Aquimarina sp. SS2-1]|uniref:uracil-DNA glycosylase family protein n=1 Tax=Aquimarina besae TaxID=3342247 RepID=UPI00366BE6B1
MQSLLSQIRSCTICESNLPKGANPIISVVETSKIALISQAPGLIAHKSGIPWNDPGGKRLKNWLGVSDTEFYDQNNFAIVPMGLCYPGKGNSGDLPPRPECAPLWHNTIFNFLKNLQLIILIGSYSQQYYLKENVKSNLTETVKSYEDYLPKYFPIPHPSPRNRFWCSNNPWYEKEVIPQLQSRIRQIITNH